MAAAPALISRQTPSVSRMRRAPLPSAVVRSSKLGWSALWASTASISVTVSGVSCSASARLAPTMPPPTIATSQRCTMSFMREASCGRHERFDLVRGFRHIARKHLTAGARDCDVVLDAHADIPETPRHAAGAGGDVNARLDRQHHAGLEHAPFIADLVVADVVHVHTEPVAGAVHEELLVVT